MSMKMTFTGIDKVRAQMKRAAERFPNEVARALYAEAQIEKTESMRRTPVDTGALRASHVVSEPEYQGNNISVAIGVGGGAAESYAIPVHEDLEAFHKTGQAKFLESTIMESIPFMPLRIAKRIEMQKLFN